MEAARFPIPVAFLRTHQGHARKTGVRQLRRARTGPRSRGVPRSNVPGFPYLDQGGAFKLVAAGTTTTTAVAVGPSSPAIRSITGLGACAGMSGMRGIPRPTGGGQGRGARPSGGPRAAPAAGLQHLHYLVDPAGCVQGREYASLQAVADDANPTRRQTGRAISRPIGFNLWGPGRRRTTYRRPRAFPILG